MRGCVKMPSWSIHLAIAKKVNQKLQLNKDLFYYGNLVPDVDYNPVITRRESHFYDNPFPPCPQEKMINLSKFLEVYKDKLYNPLILGYYTHLLTDSYFNSIVYTKCWVQDKDHNVIGVRFKNNKVEYVDIEDKKKIKRKYKHQDFRLYGKYLFLEGKVELPENMELVLENIDLLQPKFLNESLVNQRFAYLNNDFKRLNKLTIKEKLFKHHYNLFTKEELDKMCDDCAKYIIKEIEVVCKSYI